MRQKLNSTVDKCNEVASYSVFKQSNKKVFHCFSDLSSLSTMKLTHRKRKAEQATQITGYWFKKVITVSETELKKLN